MILAEGPFVVQTRSPEWGGREMTVIDPVGNRITFTEPDTGD